MEKHKAMKIYVKPWQNWDTPEKRKHIFRRLAVVFGLIFLFAAISLCIMGWISTSSVQNRLPYKITGGFCLLLSVVIFSVYLIWSCCSHRCCLSCDNFDQEATRASITVEPMPKPGKALRCNKVAPIECWGEKPGSAFP